MKDLPCRFRLSPALRALLASASPNTSAALRALLLLGAHAAGYDLTPYRADLGRLLGAPLAAPIQHALTTLATDGRTAVGHLSYRCPTSDLPIPDRPPTLPVAEETPHDPFSTLGLEV